jgi:hypothetical protein
MSKDLWGDEPFRDGAPVMENGQWKEQETYTPAPDTVIRAAKIKEAQAIAAQANQYEEELDIEELTDQVAQDEDSDDFTEVMSDARLRIEQGKLYEMIMNHDLFADVDADPRAAKAVQKQIRNFARESLEVMLGMRSTVPAHATGPEMRNASPFNDLEVDVLKKLASAASKGATEQVEEDQPHPAQPPKKKTLNSIGQKTNPVAQQRVNAKPIGRPVPGKPIQKKVEPIARTAKPKSNLPPEFEPDYEPLDKPIHEMSAAELAERDRQALERQAGRKSAMPADRAPMPDFATQEMIAMSQASRATGGAGMAGLNGKLSSLIINNQIKRY